MALQSQLFRGDRELEAAAVSDPAHILRGASGQHVTKIQQALIQLDGAAIAPDGVYGSRTAAAVGAFKQKRQILNSQGKIDDIVGKKTTAALDAEMLAKERGSGPGPNGDLAIEIEGPTSLPQVNAPPAARLQFALTESAVVGQSQSLQLAPRRTAPPRVNVIAITGTPQMPLMSFRANVRGADPTVVFQTKFDWVLDIRFNGSECRNGPNRSINHTVRQSDTGDVLIPILSVVRGGSLTVSVTAIINGKTIRDRISGIRIVATNPTRTELFSALPNNTMRRVALQESGGKQFAGAANGGVSACPLWSGDKLGGAGIFQITLPRPSDDEVWNWRSNVAGGLRIFNQKLAGSQGYPARVRNSGGFQQLVRAFNADRRARRLPPLTITLPDFTTGDFDNNLQQLELDAIRGFNGFAGGDGLGHELHEFRVALDRGRLKVVNINAQANTGEAEWERVPASQRPQGTGDPNYVANVLRQQL